MRIEIRSDSVLIDGYVNAVGRDSKPVITPHGKVVEQIVPGAFQRALDRAENVEVRLNHNPDRKLNDTSGGETTLFEDNIGLRAIVRITDPEVIQLAREKKLVGWSFGMYVNKDHLEERAENIPRRYVEELDLFEVSIVDDRLDPVYAGTSIEQRAKDGLEVVAEKRGVQNRVVTVEDKPAVDYTEYENKLQKLASGK